MKVYSSLMFVFLSSIFSRPSNAIYKRMEFIDSPSDSDQSQNEMINEDEHFNDYDSFLMNGIFHDKDIGEYVVPSGRDTPNTLHSESSLLPVIEFEDLPDSESLNENETLSNCQSGCLIMRFKMLLRISLRIWPAKK